jgi:KaiC/GvpD/RAD55 family RecA-like ATPase
MGWIETVKATIFAGDAIVMLGIGERGKNSAGPCPACNAQTRGGEDRRGPLGITSDRRAWTCHACKARGSVIDLLSYVRLGRPATSLTPDQWAALRGHAVALRWCTEEDAHAAPQPSRRGPQAPGGREIVVSVGKTKEPPPMSGGEGGGKFGWSPDLAERCERALTTPEGAHALHYLREVRRLSEESIRTFHLGAFLVRDGAGKVVEEWVTIPLLDRTESAVNVRFRSVPGPCLYCGGRADGCERCRMVVGDKVKSAGVVTKQYRVCPSRPLPLYGCHLLPDNLSSWPIVTEGELDVVALHTLGWTSGVVSGTSGAASFADEWVDQLEPYSGFVLAYDNDERGNEGAEKLVERLGRGRCSRAVLPLKDAGECLAAGVQRADIDRAFRSARPAIGIGIATAGQWRDAIKDLRKNPSALRGDSVRGSPAMTARIGGLRPGLVIVTGETGQGKTTLTTWLLGDQSADGTPVGLTSFEQSPIGTVQKLLRAVVGGDFGNPNVTDDSIDDAFDILDNRPIHIIDHRGELPFATLLGVVDYMVRRLGVRRLLIDHLGFIVNPETKDERLEIQNVVRKLSIVAEHQGVTIFLICHPSNQHVSQQRRVTLADLKGASAIRQDAHEVWVVTQLQATAKRPPTARIHFDKVRSEYGRAGSYVDLAFDRHACVYADRWEDTPAGRRGQKWEVESAGRRGQKWEVESDEVSSGVDTVTKGRRPKKKAAEGPTPPPDAPPLFHGNERDYHDTDRE